MTCRHTPDDPNCSSNRNRKIRTPVTPDAENYEIEEAQRVGKHLVLKVKYPNCANCAFEGSKIMVFLNVPETEVLKWKKIDPHFRDMEKNHPPREAPSPAARFPANSDGWCDAVAYAQGRDVD